MYAGQVVEMGTAQAIFSAPAHPYTRGLLDCIPVPGKTRRGEKLGTIPGMVPSLIGEMRGCRFAGRCPYVAAACREREVPLEPGQAPEHLVRCIRHAEIGGLAARPAHAEAS
jgi:peptide/nickel transport system ATP-binding protein